MIQRGAVLSLQRWFQAGRRNDLAALLELSHDACGVVHAGVLVHVNQVAAGYGLRLGEPLPASIAAMFEASSLGTTSFQAWLDPSTLLEWRLQGTEDVIYFSARDITASHESQARVEQALQEARRYAVEIEQLAYAVSHDLQEPLRTITNYANFLREDTPQLGDIGNKHIEYVIDAAKCCRERVRALLGYSRLGQEIELRRVCPMDTARRALSLLGAAVEEAEATVVAAPLPEELLVDAALLDTLYLNLISNALKFSAKPAKIWLGGFATASHWVLSVQDSGIGIDAAHKELIFKVFKRLDTTRPGVGIGLATCRKAASLLGGSVWVESKVGEGSTFYFSIARKHDGQAYPSGRESCTRCISGSARAAEPEGAEQCGDCRGWGSGLSVLARGGALCR